MDDEGRVFAKGLGKKQEINNWTKLSGRRRRMKEYIYILQTYEYDTYYSFSGISESEIFVHLTEDGARKHAEKIGLIVKDYPGKDTEVTIYRVKVED